MTNYNKVQDHLKSNQYTWLITGAAGFIGSNLLEKLLTLNQKVVGLDNFETGYQHNIDQALEDAALKTKDEKYVLTTDSFRFIEGDIKDIETCRLACENVDYVLHQAALGSVPRSIEDPIHTNKANIDGFLNMLVAAKDAKVKRFVYAASSSTYGDHPGLPKIEDSIGSPLSPYAVTKLVNELYATAFSKNYGFKSIGLRYFNVFGKRQDPTGGYAAVIPKWVSSILSNESVFINGDGSTTRDFCFIDNTVQINLLAALVANENSTDQIYNVAVNARTSLNELYQMIENRIIERVDNVESKKPIYCNFRIGDIKHSRADISKAVDLLGYTPSHSISEGLDEAIDWYVS